MRREPVRWALIARPKTRMTARENRIAIVLLESVPREVERGALLIAREDAELCQPAAAPRTDEDAA